MAHEQSTIHCTLKYAVEKTAGTRPTSGFTKLPGLKSLPATGDAPNTLQVTDLDDEWHRYIPGVQDTGGAREYTFNDTAEVRTAWATLKTAYETAEADGKAIWFEESFPGTGVDSFYFAGIPSNYVVNDRGVDAVIEGTGYITPNQIAGFATASA
jgi:hypothetical protein